MSDEPLIPGPLYGLRTWRVVAEDGHERLAAPHRGTTWPAAREWLHASCPRDEHDAPAAGCDCGVHAWHPRRGAAKRVLGIRGEIPGIVEADGAVEVHQDGFRSKRARPHALVLMPGRNAALAARLAEAYRVPVVELDGPDALLAWCRERGLGLDERVVARLLGPEPVAERRRRGRRDALRVLAALVVGALLVLAGAQVTGAPDHDLQGRTGKVKVP